MILFSNGEYRMKKNIKYILKITFLTAGLLLSANQNAFSGVYINLVAVNASSAEKKQAPIKYYLPSELHPEDVVETGGLKIDYDLERSAYFLYGSVELAPKETRTIRIEVKDVWHVTPEEVDILGKQIDENLAALEGTDYFESGKILRDAIVNRLEFILVQQATFSENLERRIEEYRAFVEELKEIRKNALSAAYLKSTPRDIEEQKTVKFIIEVKNPSTTDKKKVKQKHFLPVEVRAEHVLDAQRFEIRFDENKQQAFLTKEEEFSPGQTKRYEIVLKDIWSIPQGRVDVLKERAQIALDGVKGSNYEEGAQFIFDESIHELGDIENSQQDRSDMKKYVGAYRVNKDRFKTAEENVTKLEMMLASVQAKKLEEFEKGKVKNILQKMQALRGVMAISQAIFGKKPSINMTWKVIWGILIFVAFFTALHFFTWWGKAQDIGEELAIKAGGKLKAVEEAKETEEAGVEKKK